MVGNRTIFPFFIFHKSIWNDKFDSFCDHYHAQHEDLIGYNYSLIIVYPLCSVINVSIESEERRGGKEDAQYIPAPFRNRESESTPKRVYVFTLFVQLFAICFRRL